MNKLLAAIAVSALLLGAGGTQPPYPSGAPTKAGGQGGVGPTGATGPAGPSGLTLADGGVIQGGLTVSDSLLADGGILVPEASKIDVQPSTPGTVFINSSGTSLQLHTTGLGLLSGGHWASQFDIYAGSSATNKAGLRSATTGNDPLLTSDWSNDANRGIDTAMNGTGTFQINGIEAPVTPTWVKNVKQAMVQGGTKACASSAYQVTFADAGGLAFSAVPKWCIVTDEQGSTITVTVRTATQLGGVCVGTDTVDWQCWGDK
jgi:hypothetical protein